jgi:hypothetical protein
MLPVMKRQYHVGICSSTGRMREFFHLTQSLAPQMVASIMRVCL